MVWSFEMWRFEDGVITIQCISCILMDFNRRPLNCESRILPRSSVPSAEAYLITPKFPARI
jgi:hypothetical protein